MDFSILSELYEQLENTSSGNELREILAEFFKKTPIDEIQIVSYLVLGKIAPDYQSAVLGFAEKSVLKAISKASGKSVTEITTLFKHYGDVGLAAQDVFAKKPITLLPVGKLTIKDLYETLHKIVNASGTGSLETKTNLLITLYQKTLGIQAKYLTRIVLGTMRLGVADMGVLDALSISFVGDKSARPILEHAYNIHPDVGLVAHTLANKGIKEVEKIPIVVGIPIRMMAAQRVSQIKDIKEKITGPMALEAKYDGERVQIHKTKEGKVKLFSRRLENIGYQFPDIVEYILKETNCKECIIEAEIIPFSKEGKHLGFHTLMQRKRKTEIEKYAKKIPVKLFCFELLYMDGESYLKETYPNRITTLKKCIKGATHLQLTQRIETNELKDMQSFFTKMLKSGYEGLIAKSQNEDSFYKAGARAWQWIKWKKDYEQDLVDSFDLVIIGAFVGKGKRKGSYGSLLCATYNSKKDVFESVTKLGTGLTDKDLTSLPKLLNKNKVARKPLQVHTTKEMQPDVWFTPTVVVEVTAAEISEGGMHTCSENNGRGLALRFPRFIKVRDDKTAQLATTSSEVRQMYEK
jgi:DNA ligase 1